jgi:hypothetical protein
MCRKSAFYHFEGKYVGKLEVEQSHFRPQALEILQRLLAIPRLSHHFEVRDRIAERRQTFEQ